MKRCLIFSQVPKIPKTFFSTRHYMNSFIPALIEETHSDMFSSLMSVSHAPICEISMIAASMNFDPPEDLFYQVTLKRSTSEVNDVGKYEPEVGDLFALTYIKPRSIDDLIRTKRYFQIAYIRGSKDEYTDEIPILLSQYMELESDMRRNKAQKLYAVYLTNITTNIRIWNALKRSQLEGSNMNILKKVLQPDTRVRITK